MSIESRSRQYGVVFDHWQIKEFLGSGSGGKSAVFRLSRMDSSWGSSALKVISLIEEKGDWDSISDYRRKEYEQAKADCRTAAEQEVHLMDSLHGNTNIVDYLDHKFVSWSDETGFGCDMLIRMELLEDLRSKLRDGRLYSETEILKIGRDICTALVLCHGKDILHRDIKPENIFINSDGNFKLGDFGVSRILSSAPTAVASTGIGTPEYAAPEQFMGRHDKRVDIYSLGLVLYELSNGNKLPFASTGYARPMDVERRQLGEPLPAPSNASAGLAQVLLKACAYQKEDRYQTAEEFLDALNRLSGIQTPPSLRIDSNATRKAAPAVGGNVTQRAYADSIPKKQPPAPAPVYPEEKTASWKKFLIPALIVAVIACGAFLIKPKDQPEKTEPKCTHTWLDADCTTPRTCSECGETSGSALGHTWLDADCANPKTCSTCGKTSGSALGHTWLDATYNDPQSCTTCGAVGDPKKTPTAALRLQDVVTGAKASSIYSGDNLGWHGPEKMYDGKLNTNWTENASGSGVGEYAIFYFDDVYAVNKFRIYIGSHFSEGVYKENCRPKVITLTFSDGSTERIKLEDTYSEQVITFDRFYYTDSVKLTIEEVYVGKVYPDTVIAELDFELYRP